MMDTLRMAAAAGGVLLLAGTGLLAWRCHAKGLIGRRRALTLAGAAACALLAAAGMAFAFAPRTHYVEPEPRQEEQGEGDGVEVDGEAGRVSYTTAALGVDPAPTALPEPEAEAEADPGDAAGPDDAQAQDGDLPGGLDPAPEAEAGQPSDADAADGAGQAQQGAGPYTYTYTYATAGDGGAQQPAATTQPSYSEPAAEGPARRPAGLEVEDPTGTVTVDALGGGSCFLVTLPGGSAVLVGSGTRDGAEALCADLAAEGVSAIDALVLADPSDATSGGAEAVMSAFRVARLALPGSGAAGGWEGALSEAARTGAEVVDASGSLAQAGGAEVDAVAAGSGVAVRVSFGGRSALLCGPCGAPADPGRADVLAVASGAGDALGADAARSAWPCLAVVGGGAGEGELSALRMAEVYDASSGLVRVTVTAGGAVSASGSETGR